MSPITKQIDVLQVKGASQLDATADTFNLKAGLNTI